MNHDSERVPVTRAQLAALLGLSLNHVTRLVGEGMPCERVGGGRGNGSRFDAVAALEWQRQRQLEADSRETGRDARTEYAQALAERVRMDIAEKRGELVSRDAVIHAGQSYTKAWTAKVRALPRQLVSAGALPREGEPAAAVVCRNLLEEICGWKTMADAQRAAGVKAPRRRKGRR